MYKAFFYSVDGASLPRLHSARTRHENSEKWKWTSSAGAIGFHWKSNGRRDRRKFFNSSASFSPSSSLSPPCFANPFLASASVLSSIGSAEWPFTFFLCRPRTVTRILFKSRINRERKLAWMQPIDTTTHRGGNRLLERGRQRFNSLWHSPFPRVAAYNKVALANTGWSEETFARTHCNFMQTRVNIMREYLLVFYCAAV